MELTVVHKSELDYIQYEYHYCDRTHDCILPESLYQLQEAYKANLMFKRGESQTAHDFFINELEDYVVLINSECTTHVLQLAEEETSWYQGQHNFLDVEARKLLEKAEQFARQSYDKLLALEESDEYLGLTESDYERLIIEHNEYQEVIQKLIRQAYQIAIPSYVNKYFKEFGTQDLIA